MSVERSIPIRKGVAADAAGIARVHVDSWRSTYRGLVPDGYLKSLSHEKGTEKVKGWFKHPLEGFEALVAEERPGSIVGFATCGLNRDKTLQLDGELFAIYLLEQYLRRGIGRALACHVARRLKERGLHGMITWVLAGNRATGFYEALGGTRIAKKFIDIGGKQLEEIAYGWSDVHSLASIT
ncbi:MAG: GNAT family N-acetyltransferase [Candidatus Lokiarchaeota archaeon]|nr:GNAT family N-acetyltransferase [Candidatus Lokiarchaeota archaeon]